jgi:hypothetical protein
MNSPECRCHFVPSPLAAEDQRYQRPSKEQLVPHEGLSRVRQEPTLTPLEEGGHVTEALLQDRLARCSCLIQAFDTVECERDTAAVVPALDTRACGASQEAIPKRE